MSVMLHTWSISRQFLSPDLCKISTNIHVVQKRGYIAVLPSIQTKEIRIYYQQASRSKNKVFHVTRQTKNLFIYY